MTKNGNDGISTKTKVTIGVLLVVVGAIVGSVSAVLTDRVRLAVDITEATAKAASAKELAVQNRDAISAINNTLGKVLQSLGRIEGAVGATKGESP